MPDTLLLVNLKDTHHLEHLTWAVYNGALLVGSRPELLGECQWCTVLAGIFKHIYKGCDKMAHCPPYTLVSWDCQQRTEVACKECRQNASHCSHNDGLRARAQRLRSSSRVILRCQAERGGPDTPVVPHPTHHCRGTTVQRNSFPQGQIPHPSSPQL